MAGFLGEDQVRRVKEAVDLVQLIGDYVPVQRAGANFKCCCPFHDERTPSFMIYSDSQHYHCYGCGVHGDAISFVRDKENLEFLESVEQLARRAGIELVYQDGGDGGNSRSRREALLEIMDRATRLYERYLWEREEGAEARSYLAERGLSEALCRRYRLGWAPGRNRLLESARRERFTGEEICELDLAVERNGRLADRFFERLIFPICDRFGRPIAFSGRLLPEAQRRAREQGRGIGKYVNSTDTPLYHKSDVVFNLHQARKLAREAGRVLVMEGPTDVMAADQAGFGECVAVLGTALSAEHARQLGKLIGERGELIMLFDGDEAGQGNARKAVATCLSVGVPTRVAVMPEEADPAELLGGGEAGRAAFLAAIEARRGDLDHLLRSLAPRPHELDERERLRVVDDLLVALRPIADRDLRDGYLREAARYLGSDEGRLRRRLAGTEEAPARARSAPDDSPDAPLETDERQELVLHVLVRHPELRARAFDELGFEPSVLPAPWRRVVDILLAEPDLDGDGLLLRAGVVDDDHLRAAVHRWLASTRTRHGLDLSEPGLALAEAVGGLMRQHLAGEERRLQHLLRQEQEGGEEHRMAELFESLRELQVRIRRLESPSGAA